ncbi:MAG: hypothetical protein AB7S36_01600 [Planctomycetota bacterium]
MALDKLATAAQQKSSDRRERAAVSVKQLAERLGVSTNHVYAQSCKTLPVHLIGAAQRFDVQEVLDATLQSPVQPRVQTDAADSDTPTAASPPGMRHESRGQVVTKGLLVPGTGTSSW